MYKVPSVSYIKPPHTAGTSTSPVYHPWKFFPPGQLAIIKKYTGFPRNSHINVVLFKKLKRYEKNDIYKNYRKLSSSIISKLLFFTPDMLMKRYFGNPIFGTYLGKIGAAGGSALGPRTQRNIYRA